MATDTFDPEIHEYRRDGKIVYSVTQILERMGLTESNAPPARRDHAAWRGTVLDRLIEELERGDEPELTDAEEHYRDQLIPRLDAYRLFRSEVPIHGLVMQRWRVVEFGPYLYGVTPDIECVYDGKPAIIEIKNTYSEEVSHPIQTAAQAVAVYGPNIRYGGCTRMALYLKPNGKYKLKTHGNNVDFMRWELLLAAHEEIRAIKGK